MSNLARCFPEKTEAERLELTKAFYRHFCDIVLESIKGVHLSPEEAKKRYYVPDKADAFRYFRAGRSSIMAGSHIGNWEWAAMGAPLQAPGPVIVFFKFISNQRINDYMRASRMKFGSEFCDTRQTAQTFERYLDRPSFYCFLADQYPSNLERAHWVDFFGSKTPFLYGIAKYAQAYDLPILMLRHRRVSRGHYETWAEPIIENPRAYSPEEITAIYAKELEAEIRVNPAIWLWTHKRWKHEA